jgi:hypothetical protein
MADFDLELSIDTVSSIDLSIPATVDCDLHINSVLVIEDANELHIKTDLLMDWAN